jgi:hypothetical protein
MTAAPTPDDVVARIAALGLSEAQGRAVEGLLRETDTAASDGLERRRRSDRDRKSRERARRRLGRRGRDPRLGAVPGPAALAEAPGPADCHVTSPEAAMNGLAAKLVCL